MNVDKLNYIDDGFQMFRNAIDGTGLDIIADVFKTDFQQFQHYDNFSIGDSQVSKRVPLHQNNLYCNILNRMQPLLESAARVALLPTYCYPVVNVPGSLLKRHVDRDACEFTATLTICNEPSNIIWPIYAQLKDKSEIRIDMNPGDLCFYDGRDAEHWRDSLPDDQYNVSIFLHYVRVDGDFVNSHDLEKDKLHHFIAQNLADSYQKILANINRNE